MLRQKAKETAEKTSETVQDKTRHAAEKVHSTKEHAKAKAEQMGSKMVHTLENNVEFFKENAKEKAQALKEKSSEKVAEVSSSAKHKLRESITEGARKLKDSSSTVLDAFDPRASTKRLRNRLLLLGASGIFLYGFASNLPDAMAKYAIRKVEIEEAAAAAAGAGGGNKTK